MHPADLELLADLVANRLADRLAHTAPALPSPQTPLLSAAQVADRFGVERSWVYDHAGELGAIRLGDGPRPRLRFDARRVADALERRAPCEAYRGSSSPDPPASADVPARWRRRPAASSAQLLPIRGRER